MVELPVASTYDWTGAYFGLHGGYAWGNGSGAYFAQGVRIETADLDADGFLVGGQVGYNHQIGALVVGVEGELSYLNASGTGRIYNFFTGLDVNAHTETEVKYLASVTGRLGYAADRTLLYAKGGVGFTQIEIADFNDPAFFNASGKDSATGWTVGGGVEYAVTNNWTVKGEYQFYRFAADVAVDNPAPFRVYDDNFDVHAAKIGFNFKF